MLIKRCCLTTPARHGSCPESRDGRRRQHAEVRQEGAKNVTYAVLRCVANACLTAVFEAQRARAGSCSAVRESLPAEHVLSAKMVRTTRTAGHAD